MQTTVINESAAVRAKSSSDTLQRQAREIYRQFPGRPSWTDLRRILADRSLVHYPCEVRFEMEPLLPGEFVFTVRNGPDPAHGFTIFVHPSLLGKPRELVTVVLGQIPGINTGASPDPEAAEQFGGTALGVSREAYYEELCAIAASLDTRFEQA
jgi:hypothetical protein